MKGNKIVIVFLLIIAIVGIIGFLVINYLKDKQVNSQPEEITPQQEITEEQMRKTMVSLYFYNNETGNLEEEARLIDAVELLENPYYTLVQLLIDGPKNEKLKTLIPDNVIINSATIIDNCVTLDMSPEFLIYTEDGDLKNKMINSIVNTLTELTEVETVKFLINEEKNSEFSENYVRI